MTISDIVNNVKVYGLEDSIRRAKFPMSTDVSEITCELTDGIRNLATAARGSGHDNFLKGIVVQFDLTFTVKAWTQAERYHWFDIVSSQSTMHRISRFNISNSYIKYVDPRCIDVIKEKIWQFNNLKNIGENEAAAEKYLEILYTNPAGCKLTAGITTNYQQLKTIYAQRKRHV